MKKVVIVTSLFLSIFLFQGCNNDEIEKLQSENAELQNTNDELQSSVNELEGKLSNIESYVSDAKSNLQSASMYLEDARNYVDDFSCREGTSDIEGAVYSSSSSLDTAREEISNIINEI